MFIVDDILDKLKNILKTDSKTKKVFDKELAEALDLTQANFATMKNRGKIPYTNILNFCAKRKISEICNNKRGISARFALELERVFGISAEFWVTMQAKWDVFNERQKAA